MVSYLWETLETATATTGTSVGITDSLAITNEMVGKYIKITVTDDANQTFSGVSTSPVTADGSKVCSIIDTSGLQADGTALVGDTLSVTYGSDFGIPQGITWYANDVVARSTDFTSDTAALSLTTGVAGSGADYIMNEGTAVIYAIVNLKDGTKVKTENTITLTAAEQPVTATTFDIVNDYEKPTLTYDATDTNAVVAITLSKDVAGDLYIYKDSVAKYGDGNNVAKIAKADFAKAVQVTKKTDLTAKVAVEAAAYATDGAEQTGIYYNNSDGSITYMIKVADGDMAAAFNLNRGTTYKAVFDQDGIDTDDIGATPRDDVKVTNSVTAPYITAPAKIALTTHKPGAQPKITLYNEAGEVLTWMSKAGDDDEVEAYGIASFITYDEKGSTKAKAHKAAHNLTDGAGNSHIEKGVITGNENLGAADTYENYWAYIKTDKGVFAATAIELESDLVGGSEAPAKVMNIVDKKDAPKTAVITFSKLKTAGTVYVIEGDTKRDSAANMVKYFDKDDPSTYTAKADVEKGATEVTIENAFQSYEDSAAVTNGVNYLAYFVPADGSDYDVMYATDFSNTKYKVADADSSSAFKLAQVPTSVAFDKDTAGEITGANGVFTITGTTLLAKDQFGDTIQDEVEAADADSVTVKSSNLTTEEKGAAKYAIADGGQLTVALTTIPDAATNISCDKGDSFTIEVLGTKIEAKGRSTVMGNEAQDADASALLWEVKVGSDDLFALPTAAKNAAGVTFKVASVGTATVTVTCSDDDNDSYITATPDGTYVDLDGAVAAGVATFKYNSDGTDDQLVIYDDGVYKRTLTYTATAATPNITAFDLVSDILTES